MTAVNWLIEELKKVHHPTEAMIMYAKKLEKQQIIDAYDEGEEYEYQYHINNTPKFDSQTYFTETYGSKGSDNLPKVQNKDSFGDTSSQTEAAMIIPEAISILKIHQKWRLGADIVMIEPKELTKAIDVLINYHTDIMNETLSSQTEISDEEIEEMLFHHSNEYAYGFKDAIKWYREQLKSKVKS